MKLKINYDQLRDTVAAYLHDNDSLFIGMEISKSGQCFVMSRDVDCDFYTVGEFKSGHMIDGQYCSGFNAACRLFAALVELSNARRRR